MRIAEFRVPDHCICRRVICATVLPLAVTPCLSSAFEVETHAAMTAKAVVASGLSDDFNSSLIIKRLGLVEYPKAPTTRFPSLGRHYLYQAGSPFATSKVVEREDRALQTIRDVQDLQIPGALTISDWILRGAIREDDNTSETSDGDDPNGVFDRVFGHFFDPVLNRGLTVSLFGQTVLGPEPRAVDWALDPAARVVPIGGGSRANQFKVADAREAMWRALTLKTASMGDDVFPSGWGNDAAAREGLRKAYWATTFRTLGDVVHLLQDMAQPQHTRNDAHAGRGCVPGVGCVGGHASFFENYLAARTTAQLFFSLEEGVAGVVLSSLRVNVQSGQLSYSGYTPPRFSGYSDYFAKGSNAEGKGLANYSNRGFYSAGTNINSAAAAQYPSPNPTGSGLGFEVVTSGLKDRLGNAVTGSVTFRTGGVQDKVNNTTKPDVKLSATGLFDQFLVERNPNWSQYTLNYKNYEEHADLLVPRAVGYSAGLIDYFFRGQMYVASGAEGLYSLLDHGDPGSNCKDTCGFTKVKLKVANATPDITPPGEAAVPQQMGAGTLVLVAKFRRNTCYTNDLAGEFTVGSQELELDYYNRCVNAQPEEIVVSNPISNTTLPLCNAGASGSCEGAAIPLTFTFPTSPTQVVIPINAASLSLQVVFRGPLGSEQDAVVVETVNVSEPSYFSFMNASDYIKLGAEAYTREEINAPTAGNLRSQVQPQSCIENDQLKASCAQPIAQIAFPLTWGSSASPGVTSPLDLPVRSYSRFAMLLPPGSAGAVFQELSPCTPHLPMPVPERRLQEGVVIDAAQSPPAPQPPVYKLNYTVDPSNGVARGVVGGALVACVALGDGVPVALPESAFVRMSTFTAQERVAKPIQGFAFGN